MGRPCLLGFRGWSVVWCDPFIAGRVGADRYPDCPPSPVLSARCFQFLISSRRREVMLAQRRTNPGFFDGLISLALALVLSLPWFVMMVESHGCQVGTALIFPAYGAPPGHPMSLLPRLIKLAPVTLPLGLYGAMRAVRLALVDEFNTLETVGGSFWVVWLAVAALAPAVWPHRPSAVPLTWSCSFP